MMNSEYFPRILDSIIDKRMEFTGGIYLTGPKWCGKTTTLSRKAKTIHKLSSKKALNDFRFNYDLNPEIYFNDSDCPILFDEWQLAPEIWDEGRNFIDASKIKGCKILLTGSATLTKKQMKEEIHHSGLGRYSLLLMRPMSLWESKESNGKISLFSLFDPKYEMPLVRSDLSLEDLIFVTCRGGWPEAVLQKNRNNALTVARDIYESIKNRDVEDIIDFSGRGKDSQILERFIKSYSRNDSTQATNRTILKDIRRMTPDMEESTFYNYKDYLERFFIFDDVDSWSPNLKSRVNMSSLPKKEFIDPSIGIAAMGLSPQELGKKLFDFGFYFENMVLRDLRIYAQSFEGKVYYYRDRSGLEADAVLVLEDGRYALIEIKLGSKGNAEGAKHLLDLKKKIEIFNVSASKDMKMKLPSALIVITGSQDGARSKEGVSIVPIGCLKN